MVFFSRLFRLRPARLTRPSDRRMFTGDARAEGSKGHGVGGRKRSPEGAGTRRGRRRLDCTRRSLAHPRCPCREVRREEVEETVTKAGPALRKQPGPMANPNL